MRRASAAPAIIGVLAILAVASVLLIVGLQSDLLSIGNLAEPGYEPYDDLLVLNDYDRSDWTCDSYDTVSGEEGNFVVYGDPDLFSCRTRDLRLVNMRFTLLTTHLGDDYPSTNCLRSSEGELFCRTTILLPRVRTPETDFVELVWDDYELGHYQVLVAGSIVQEGTISEGEQFYFDLRPEYDGGGGTFRRGYFEVQDPRVKALFGDLEEGERYTSACFGGPDVVTLDDLTGFRRFDLDVPAIHVTNVQDGNEVQSQQVMYALAQDDAVVIEADEAWKFSYITLESDNLIGVESKCDEEVLVEDHFDVKEEEVTLNDQSLSFTTLGDWDGSSFDKKKITLSSGDRTFFSSTVIQIDEALCPYTEFTQTYPDDGLPKSCFSIKAWGKEFHDGDSHDFGAAKLTLDSLRVEYDKHPAVGDRYTWLAEWTLDMDETAIRIDNAKVWAETNGADYEFTLRNDLPGPVTVRLLEKAEYAIIGESSSETSEHEINALNDVSVSREQPREFLGETSLMLFPSLLVEDEGVTFPGVSASYEVVDVAESAKLANVQDEGVVEDGGFLDFLKRLWETIKGWFS